MIAFSVKPMILLSVLLIFPMLKTATTTISENLNQCDDLRIRQLLATNYDVSKQYILKQLSSL